MATALAAIDEAGGIQGSLNDDSRAIGGASFDAIFFWGAPLVAFAFVCLWSSLAILLPSPVGHGAISLLAGAVAVLTFAHLSHASALFKAENDRFLNHSDQC